MRRVVAVAAAVSLVACSGDDESALTTTVAAVSTTSAGPASSLTPVEVPDSGPTLLRLGEDEIEVLDGRGVLQRTIPVPDAVDFVGEHPEGFLVAREVEDGQLRVVDVEAGAVSAIDVGAGVSQVAAWNDTAVVVGDPVGGPLRIVDVTSGDVVDVGVLVDRPEARIGFVPVEPADSRVFPLFEGPDSGIVVVPVDDPSAAWTAVGRVLDVAGTRALVATDDAVALDDGSAVSVTAPVGGVITDEDHALVVAESGTLARIDFASGEAAEVGNVGFSPERAHAAGTDRLFVVGQESSVLIDADGTALETWDAEEPGAVTMVASGTDCAVVQPGAQPRVGRSVLLIDLADGSTILTLGATARTLTPDGCSVVSTIGDRTTLVFARRRIDLSGARLLALAPTFDHAVIAHGQGPSTTMALRTLTDGSELELPVGVYTFP